MNRIDRAVVANTPFVPLRLRDRETARLRCYLYLAVSDMIAITASFLFANWAANLRTPVSFHHGLTMLAMLLPLYVGQAFTNGAYGAATLDDWSRGARSSIRALLVAGGVVLLVAYMLKASGNFSRGVFASGFLIALLMLVACRWLLRAPLLRELAGTAQTVVVIRDGVNFAPRGAEIVLDAGDLGFDPRSNDPRAYHQLARSIARADRLIIACTPRQATVWAPVLRTLPVDGEILTDVDDAIDAIGLRELGSHRTLVINYGPLTFSARAVKRAFDIVASVTALVMLSPILLGTALAIRLDSPGTIFFRQERIGRGNRIFRVFKFRSMHTHATDEHAATLTSVGDTRVTRVGAFIRRTSIDELPQLLNVLYGEMSIVGPRPHALGAKAAELLYWDADVRYRQRHVIKPGMTGLAQVRGFRGNTQQIADLTNRLQADLEYVANWSLSRDVKIILQTLGVVWHDNAY